MTHPFRIVVWIVGIVCVLGLVYYIYAHVSVPSQQQGATTTQSLPDDLMPASGFDSATASSTSVVINDAPRTAPEGMLEYRNPTYHVSLFYPANLTVKTYDEGKGASTITFQNVATAQGFQMFIVPYAAAQISKARFMQDEPSGVMQSPLNVAIGGAPATSFYSTNALLGDTAEIWFIYGGYLYEVTAPKSEAAWFSGIMNTWQFI